MSLWIKGKPNRGAAPPEEGAKKRGKSRRRPHKTADDRRDIAEKGGEKWRRLRKARRTPDRSFSFLFLLLSSTWALLAVSIHPCSSLSSVKGIKIVFETTAWTMLWRLSRSFGWECMMIHKVTITCSSWERVPIRPKCLGSYQILMTMWYISILELRWNQLRNLLRKWTTIGTNSKEVWQKRIQNWVTNITPNWEIVSSWEFSITSSKQKARNDPSH